MKIRTYLIYLFLIIISVIAIVSICVFVQNPTISAIAATLLGSFLTFICSQLFNSIKSIRSDFAGYYRDEIFSNENPNEIIKRDKFILYERDGKVLSGSLKRYYPKETIYENWTCSGFIVLDQYLLSYRAVKDTTPSRGVILVKLDTERKNGLLPCYKGNYYKFEGEKIVECKINLIKIDKEQYDELGNETTKKSRNQNL